MIKVVDKKNNVIDEFTNYSMFDMWLMSSEFGIVDGDPLRKLKRDGGIVIVEPLTKDYLEKVLYIKEG